MPLAAATASEDLDQQWFPGLTLWMNEKKSLSFVTYFRRKAPQSCLYLESI